MTRCLFVFLALTLPAYSDPFSYQTIDAGPPPSTMTDATGINDAGQIVGYTFGATRTNFIDNDGVISTVALPVPYFATVLGINNAGTLAGYYTLNPLGLSSSGFLYANGVLTTINVPGSSSPYFPDQPSTGVNGINNLGWIVGGYSVGDRAFGFLDVNGVITTISVPGASTTYISGINDLGQMVGRSSLGAFVDNNGTFTLLQVPGSSFTAATGINNAGQIVGVFLDPATGDHGFLYDHGTYYVMGLLGSGANGINNKGQIVGTYSDTHDVGHGFVATLAVPEPRAASLLVLGLLGLAMGVCKFRAA